MMRFVTFILTGFCALSHRSFPGMLSLISTVAPLLKQSKHPEPSFVDHYRNHMRLSSEGGCVPTRGGTYPRRGHAVGNRGLQVLRRASMVRQTTNRHLLAPRQPSATSRE